MPVTLRDIEQEVGLAFSPEQASVVTGLIDRVRESETQRAVDSDDLKQALTRLAEAQARTEERLARLEDTVDQLAKAQVRTEEHLAALMRTTEDMSRKLDDLRGWRTELRYQERVGAYFGPVLRKARAHSAHEWDDELEPHLTREEFLDLLRVDLVVTGTPRYVPDAEPLCLAVEVSAVIDRHDVRRALERARLLRKAGRRAVPAVGGDSLTAGAKEGAEVQYVAVFLDGSVQHWDEALKWAEAGDLYPLGDGEQTPLTTADSS